MNEVNNNEEIRTVDDMYNTLVRMQPETVFAKRIWEGIANTFYYSAINDPYHNKTDQINKIKELAETYHLTIPSQEFQQLIKLKNSEIQNIDNIDKNLINEFRTITERESSQDL
jgi:hypothetical protein